MSKKNSPFKFLDSYKKEDVNVFFGRKQETLDLYNALSGVKHLLVYGPSGSGKSSLVECGLRNQFSDADWYALTIRKGHNINASVFMAINEALVEKIALNPKTKLPTNPNIGFGEAIDKLFEERYQPVYLLFDQFEELLISGEKQEKIDFFTNLNTLIRNRIPNRVLLIMREEFIGHFSEYEHLCPSIFQHRFRVEKMGRLQVKGVIQSMLDAPLYNQYFKVKDSQKLAENILEKLPDKSKEIELSHVQVFLGELWDRAVASNTDNDLPVFSFELLKKNDNLASVLESFLMKQVKELEITYGKRVPIELLAVMISERFTKIQLSEANILTELTSKGVSCQQPLNDLLQELQTRRIIRAIKVGNESQYEISHDTLALVVGQNLTEDMKMREKAMDIYKVLMEKEGLFSQDDIDYLRPFEQNLAYPIELKSRIDKSQADIKEKQNALRNRKKRQVRILSSLLGLAVVALVVAVFYYFSAIENEKKAEAAQKRTVKEMIDATWKVSSKVNQDLLNYDKTQSWISGVRDLYGKLEFLMDLEKLESLSPVPIYTEDPHRVVVTELGELREFNFKSNQFGHYNPEFVRWVKNNGIPASENEQLRVLTQPFYDQFLMEMSRCYYIVYLDIEAELPRFEQEVIPRFQEDLELYKEIPWEDGMGTGPGNYLQYTVFYDYSNQFEGHATYEPQDPNSPNSTAINSTYTGALSWSSEMLTYYANVAGAFWVRRMVDGTSEDFVNVLKKLLKTYDNEWLENAPEAKPYTAAGAKRFSFPSKFKEF